ncbi:MAG: hypothetical protein U1F59_03110 [Candidatus Competibacteraceae bacterium]
MIKMPLNLDPRQGADWRNTLRAALDRLNVLDAEARRLHGERGRHIRPILPQLVGRILRQPHAEKTGIPPLDECYVITHHADTARVVKAIKTGLEEDGLGDLVKEIKIGDDSNNRLPGIREIPRRDRFAKTEIYLPQVLCVEGGTVRPIDYLQDILFELDWSAVDPAPLVATIPDNAQTAERQLRRIRLTDSGQERIVAEVAGRSEEALRFDPAYAVRMVSDLVPNPWIAREIVGRVLAGLTARGFDADKLGALAGLVIEQLRQWLDGERDRMAEAVFRAAVTSGRIQFRLRIDGQNWHMPFEAQTYEPEGAEQLVGKTGGPLEKSLFAPIYKGDFSSQDERNIVVYLDGEAALTWWHRNVARRQYAVQGWRRSRIFPDFIFALQCGAGAERLVVLEMKGPQLAGNLDTEYKRAVLRLMSDHYAIEHAPPVGGLELVVSDGTTVQCDLVN